MDFNILVPQKISNKYQNHQLFIDNFFFANLEEILKKYDNYLIITDKIIYRKFNNYLSFAFNNIHIFAEEVSAKIEYSEHLVNIAENYDFLVAIGSGTINDIVKYASFKMAKNYILFATAPSMNGYLSDSASLLVNDHKKSFKAKLPLHAYFDLEIIANAPKRLIQAGLGDSLCSHICRADMILAHFVTNKYYDENLFALNYEIEDQLFSNIAKLLTSNKIAIFLLLKLLINSGYAMTIYGDSSPASQSEHMIAHLYEKLIINNNKKFYHGEIIAVTSYYCTALWDNFLNKNIAPNIHKYLPTKNFSHAIIDKSINVATAEINLKNNFQNIKDRVRLRYKNLQELKNIFTAAEIYFTPEEFGLDIDIFALAKKNAFLTRERFTILDIN
jgi:glycerol-1-phosphate dehydrogenase [NAD(P)+]